MSDGEKLVVRHGGVRIPCKRHRAYVIDGVRFTFHHGTSSQEWLVLKKTKIKLKKLGKL